MKTQEEKVLEQLVTLTESQWFNAGIVGRYLSNQPLYTMDRILEMVSHIVRNMELRRLQEEGRGITSEGLILANELNACIKAFQEDNQLNNLKLPK
jgi:hypothetical protein